MGVYIDMGVGCLALACLVCLWGHWLDIRALRADMEEAKLEVREMKGKVEALFQHHKRAGGAQQGNGLQRSS